jgi:hypothetical protein
MFYTIAIILLASWALGLLTGTAMGGFVHVLLAVAIVMFLVHLISRRLRA